MTIYVGDINTEVRLDTEISLTGATLLAIKVQKPSGTTATWTATQYGATQEITYTTISGDFNEVGTYLLQSYVEFGSTSVHYGETTSLVVSALFSDASKIEKYLDLYWPGLKTALDAIDTSIYNDLVADAAEAMSRYTTDFLTIAEKVRVQALFICVDCGGMPGLGGWSQERHYTKLKMFDRQWQKDTTNYDWAIGELCRLLHISPKELYAKTASTRANNYNSYKKLTIYHVPDLDQRGKLYKDYDLSDVEDDRKTYPLDNRYDPS